MPWARASAAPSSAVCSAASRLASSIWPKSSPAITRPRRGYRVRSCDVGLPDRHDDGRLAGHELGDVLDGSLGVVEPS